MHRQTATRRARDSTVRVSGTAVIPQVLQGFGLDPSRILAEAQLAPELFDDPENLIPLSSLLLLLQSLR